MGAAFDVISHTEPNGSVVEENIQTWEVKTEALMLESGSMLGFLSHVRLMHFIKTPGVIQD